jgi:tetratricopeptide (TPR) repeat protein
MYADLELHAGDLEAAERELREGYVILRSLGEVGYRSTVASVLASVLVELGRLDEAEQLVAEVIEIAAPDDFDPQARWRSVRARILSAKGEHDEAERLARDAVERTMGTDYVLQQAEMLAGLAGVLAAAGRPAEAAEPAAVALALLEQKGDVVGAAQARGRLDELRTRVGVPPADPGTIVAT